MHDVYDNDVHDVYDNDVHDVYDNDVHDVYPTYSTALVRLVPEWGACFILASPAP